MNIKQLKETLRLGYETRKPVLALSSPGIGKSSAVYQFVEELTGRYQEPVGMIEIRGASASPAELATVKYIKADEVQDADQAWFPTEKKVEAGIVPRHGIIFVDELGDSMMAVQSTLQRIFLDNKLGNQEMARTWYVCAASNRQKDRAASGRISTALMNRALVVTVEPDADILYSYFTEEKDMPIGIPAFLRFCPDCINAPDMGQLAKLENQQFCSPRSLEAASDLIRAESFKRLGAGLQLEILSGTIGDGEGTRLFGFLKIMNELPDLDRIEMDPDNYPIPENLDVKIATIYALLNRMTEATVENMMKFFIRMPVEIATVAIKDAIQMNRSVVAKTQGFKTWAAANADFII